MTYRHTAPAYLGDTLECGGHVTGVGDDTVELELWLRKPDGVETTKGTAVFTVGNGE